MKEGRNIIIEGKCKPIILDYAFTENEKQKPVVLFAHGFKGFKDWGHFNKLMECFSQQGFAFVKFNFSHNGGTVEQPIDFPDLEAFGNNNYSKELDDLSTVIDWIENCEELPLSEVNKKEIYLVGHSRGGGVSILKAAEDLRIKKLVTWAAVSDLFARLPEDLSAWEKDGVVYVANARTNQQMPMYYQFVEDMMRNKERFDIEWAEKNLKIPHLIIHGNLDEAVNVNEAYDLNKWNSNATLYLIEGANHTFGAKHPFHDEVFPEDVVKVLTKTIEFLKE